MKVLINKLKKVQQDGCVTMVFNTHRTSPASQGDVIQMKNLIREAENRLEALYDPAFVKNLKQKIQDYTAEINHLYNQDSMAIFIGPDTAEMVRMTVPVKDAVNVGDTFALREVLRAANASATYYALILSRRNARLIEVRNEEVLGQEFDGFPMEEQIVETDPHRLTMAAGTDNIIENFFKKVDNSLGRVLNMQSRPLVVVTEERNYHHFAKVTSHADAIVGHLNRNRDDEEARIVAMDCWPIVREAIATSNKDKIEDLQKAVSTGNFVSDVNDISRAITEGRGRTLYVKTDYYQPAKLAGEKIELLGAETPWGNGVMGDVVDLLVSGSVNQGGDVVFLEDEEMDKFEGLALLTRY